MWRKRLSRMNSPEEFEAEHRREDLRERRWRRYCELIRELRGLFRLAAVAAVVALAQHASVLFDRL
jgi:hypothetical protein